MKNVLVCIVLLGVVGCVTGVDPDTGRKTYGLDPCSVKAAENVGLTIEVVGPPIVTGVSAINPVAGSVAGAILGAFTLLLGCYRKWKVPLVEQADLMTKMSAGMRAGADVIELAKDNKDLWAKMKPILKTAEKKGAIMPNKI